VQTATNPETGETVYFDGNSWVPAKTATNPETGQTVALAGNEWVPVGPPSSQAPAPSPQQPSRSYGQQVSERFDALDTGSVLSEFMPEYSRRTKTLEKTGTDYYGNKQTYGATLSDKAAVAVSQAARTAGEIAGSYIGVVIPDAVREGAAELWDAFKETEVGKAAVYAIEHDMAAYDDWATKNPAAAERFESMVDVSAVMTPQLSLSKNALKAKKEVSKHSIETRQEGIERMMNPDNLEGEGEVIEEGYFRSKKYIPSEREDTINLTLGTVDNIDPKRSYTWNAWKAKEEIEKSDAELRKYLKDNPSKMELGDINEELNEHLTELAQEPSFKLLNTEAQKKATEFTDSVITILEERAKKGKVTPTDLLEVRREFDKFLNAGGNGKVFDPTIESAKNVAGRHIRTFLNEKVKQVTPGDEVHHLLDRMHNLLSASDRLKEGRMREAVNGPLRLWSKVKDIGNLPSTPLALYATFGTTAAVSAPFAPAVAGGAASAAAIYTAARMMSKANRLKMYAAILSATDKALKVYNSDKNMVQSLKADRAMLVDLMNDVRQAPAEEEEK